MNRRTWSARLLVCMCVPAFALGAFAPAHATVEGPDALIKRVAVWLAAAVAAVALTRILSL